MRSLVTGGGGFVGSRLATLLENKGHDVVRTVHGGASRTAGLHRGAGSTRPQPPPSRGDRLVADVTDRDALDAVVERVRPERVWHLAAQSSAARSWSDPGLTYEVNVTGTHHLLDSLRRHAPRCRVLLAASSDEYGFASPEDCPLEETSELRPVSPYAASKLAAEWVARTFVEAFGAHVVITRAFMHIGPGQPPSFAVSGWARQIALAEAGAAQPVVEVGNLELKRELGDVRDVVRAYAEVLEHGEPGEIYNVATGEARRLGDALDILKGLARIDIQVKVDPAKIRPADPPELAGSAAKLELATGWKPEFRLEDTLADVMEHWRSETARGQSP
jgi:GDP-4-dehydro-6-deoxy-D-mannose reductase